MPAGKQPEYVDVETYLVIEPRWKDWSKDAQGRPVLEGGRVVKQTANRPNVTKGGVVTKVTLRIETGCFLPLQPEAVIRVSAGNAETIEADAVDPRTQEEIDEDEALRSIREARHE